ncbi:MAG: alpha/beta hydrolase [Bdellovibrionales bacterium]|nr:alpha/beta hydrolase [Bdellovibrionales bacterium]
MPTLSLETVRLNASLEMAFRRRPGSGDALLLLHGLQSHSQLFDAVFTHPEFSAFDLIAPDFIGFGQSSKPTDSPYDLTYLSQCILQLCETLQLERFHIVGHSLGGMIGTVLLNTAAHEVLSLSSLEGNLSGADCGASRIVAQLPFPEFQNSYYPELKASLQSADEPSAVLRRAALETIPDYVFFNTSKAIVASSESEQLLATFTTSDTPRCLLIGDNSHFASRPQAIGLTIHEISKSGHFMILDNPKQTLEVVASFVRQLTN